MSALGWGTVLGSGGASMALGLWMRSLGVLSAGAAMIALRATAVPFGSPPSLGALGADIPPLPVAFAMPLAIVPALRWEPFVAVVVSSAAAGVAAWWLVGALRGMGHGTTVAIVIAAGVALHPAWLYAAASGSGSVLAAALLVAALRLYARWQRTGDALAVLGSSFALALGGLARYDLFIVGWALAALISASDGAFVTRARRPRRRSDEVEHPGAREGSPRPSVGIGPARLGDERVPFAIVYATAVTGALGLWLVVTALVTGDALAFVALSRDAVAGPPAAQLPLHALIVAVPALVLAGICAALRRGLPVVIATATIAAAAVVSSAASGAPLSLDAVVPLVPLSGLLLGHAVAGMRARTIAVATLMPALAIGGAAAIAISSDWGEGHRALAAAVTGRPSPAMWGGERDLAAFVRSADVRVLVDDRVDAVATVLMAASDRIAPIDALGSTAVAASRADLVLVRTPTGRGAAHRVALTWPTLYDGGAPWAKLVGTWPVGGEAAEYRLYAVAPVGGR